ncbi:MAG: amino acid permease [Candidatus Neomarinimicrobiota bacterium]
MSIPRRFGTFQGVFTPTILTILGVIMYLRLGWVVGNAGLAGAVIIILMAKLVTITTGLAMSSMTTNIKIGAGGSYSIISRSLGLEIGGAVGIPLYFSLTLGAAMYIVGFAEGWLTIFPEHDPMLVKTAVLVILLIVSYIGAQVALKIHYIVLAVIAASLVSLLLGQGDGNPQVVMWGKFEEAPFWMVFAVFFPAVTGIEAGAAMSGDLINPKRSLPIGILTAIGISLVVYVGLAVWYDRFVEREMLLTNYTVMIDVARWRYVVIGGLLGASLSSALGSIVGGPRTLMALGQNKVVPFAKYFARRTEKGEPRISIVFTAAVIMVSLVLGELNTIAPLLTMFFLITYGTINAAVFIEKKIGIPSYRPSFDIPLLIPFIGAVWSFVAMFLINPVFAAVSMVVIAFVYVWQVRLGHTAPWGDVRAGIFTAIAEWAVRMESLMPYTAKTWKPNLMVPVEDPQYWKKRMNFIRDIVFPRGSVRVLSVKIHTRGVKARVNEMVSLLFGGEKEKPPSIPVEEVEEDLTKLVQPLKEEGILAATTVIDANHFLEGVSIVTQALRDMPLPPNVMFLSMSADPEKDEDLKQLISIAVREELGIIVLSRHSEKGFGDEKTVNLWLRGGSPNRNLSLLTALQLERNWNGQLRLIRAVDSPEKIKKARVGLRQIAHRGRLPVDVQQLVLDGNFGEILSRAPEADLNMFGMSSDLNIDDIHTLAQICDTACLFIRDSGQESALV